MEIINSDDILWPLLFPGNQFIFVNYHAVADRAGCKEINGLFHNLSLYKDFEKVKFMWVGSRNNPITEKFSKKIQTPFTAVFKERFLVECDNVSDKKELREMLDRLFAF